MRLMLKLFKKQLRNPSAPALRAIGAFPVISTCLFAVLLADADFS